MRITRLERIQPGTTCSADTQVQCLSQKGKEVTYNLDRWRLTRDTLAVMDEGNS
jgi:hypothetical protein